MIRPIRSQDIPKAIQQATQPSPFTTNKIDNSRPAGIRAAGYPHMVSDTDVKGGDAGERVV